ncbi:MAG: hypothetical protein ABGY09_05190 [Euryarchaeota archaeon]
MRDVLWGTLEAIAVIGAGYLLTHGLGAASSRVVGPVPLVALGAIHPHVALAAAREAGLRGTRLLIAKLSFNSLPYLASVWCTSLALLGRKVGVPYAVTLTLVDATETLIGALALRGVRVEPPRHRSWRAALRTALRSTARATAFLVPGMMVGTLLARWASGWLTRGTVLGAFLVNPVAGCSVLSGLLSVGGVSPAEAYRAAVVGAAVAYVGRLLRSCGPVTVAVTGPAEGVWLSAVTTLVDVTLALAYGALVGRLAFG